VFACDGNNNDINANIYGAVVMAIAIAGVHLVHVMNVDSLLDGC